MREIDVRHPDKDRTFLDADNQAELHRVLIGRLVFYLQKYNVDESKWRPQLEQLLQNHRGAAVATSVDTI